MTAMTEKDRDVLRFLWVDDVSKPSPETIVLQFKRVWGVVKLNATIRHHLEKYAMIQSDLVNKLLTSTYVDDIITGAESEEVAYKLYKDSKELLKGAGFNLRMFTSNSSQLCDKVEGEETPHSSDVNHNPPVSSNTEESEDLHTSHSRRFSEISLRRAEDIGGDMEC